MKNDPLQYIRMQYGVQARKNRVVKIPHRNSFGMIVGASGLHVKVLLSEEKSPRIYHPKDIDYLDDQHLCKGEQ